MIASLLSEDVYSMFCLSAAMRVLLPENAMPIFIIDVTFIACKSTLYARSLICCKATLPLQGWHPSDQVQVDQ